jgi:hypothetical protein
MDTLLVGIIVGAATIYIVRTFYRKFKTGKDGSNGCGCTSCGLEKADSEPFDGVQNGCCESKK